MIYTIYGRPKVGKTTFALRDAPKGKTAIINADKGLAGSDLTGITVIDDINIQGINELIVDSNFIETHDRVIIDTVTALYEDLLLDISEGRAPSLHQRGLANYAFNSLIRNLRNSGKEIILLGQERVTLPTEDWDSDDEDEYATASVTVDLPAGTAKTLTTMSDVIARLYMVNTDRGTARRLWLTPTPNIVAGARSSVYRGNPPYLKSPSIEKLNKLLGWTH